MKLDDETDAMLRLWHALAPAQRASVYRHAASFKRERPVASADTRGAAGGVVGALRALVRRYPNVERKRLIAQAGELLAQHQLAGQPAAAVIARLEELFAHEAARGTEER